MGRSVWPVCIREEREGEGIWKVSIFNLGEGRARRMGRTVSLPTAPPTNLESEREWIMDGEGRKKRGSGTYHAANWTDTVLVNIVQTPQVTLTLIYPDFV